MTVIVETGRGVMTANSYAPVSFVSAYLTARNRQTENSWDTISVPAQEASVIAATSYIDTRWGGRFKGVRKFLFDGVEARAIVTISGQPSDGDQVTVGEETFTFVTTLDDFNVNEILIGADADASIENFIVAVDNAGEVDAQLRENTTDQVLLTHTMAGVAGNETPLSVAAGVVNVAVTQAFQHGADAGSQPLEFPRASLFDRAGHKVEGIPTALRHATAEYAVRAAASTSALWQDPTVDATGRAVVEFSRKVGPIERRFRFEDGAALSRLIKPFPTADRLLRELVTPSGAVIRG